MKEFPWTKLLHFKIKNNKVHNLQVHCIPFKAMTLLEGFIIAESAEMGLLRGFVGSAISTITTWD